MEKKKEKIGAWHDEPVHLDFISVHGPLRATEGIGADDEDPQEDAKDTLEISPDNAGIWREWTVEASRRAGRVVLSVERLLDEQRQLDDSVSA
jgi:hypothetical protein